jgi:ketosteroid isomerase-like protein
MLAAPSNAPTTKRGGDLAMTPAENTKIIQDAYAAFGRRDVASLIGMMSPDIDFQAVVGASSKVPSSGHRVGHEQVTQFFTDLAGGVDFDRFEPQEFIAERDRVVVLGHYAGRAKPTSRHFESDWVMIFTLRDGKIVRFREFADVATINAAYE